MIYIDPLIFLQATDFFDRASVQGLSENIIGCIILGRELEDSHPLALFLVEVPDFADTEFVNTRISQYQGAIPALIPLGCFLSLAAPSSLLERMKSLFGSLLIQFSFDKSNPILKISIQDSSAGPDSIPSWKLAHSSESELAVKHVTSEGSWGTGTCTNYKRNPDVVMAGAKALAQSLIQLQERAIDRSSRADIRSLSIFRSGTCTPWDKWAVGAGRDDLWALSSFTIRNRTHFDFGHIISRISGNGSKT